MQQWILYGGGLDSTALAMMIMSKNDTPHLIHVDYGQKAAQQERKSMHKMKQLYNLPVHELSADLSFSKSSIMTGGIADSRGGNRLELRNPFLVTLAASYIASTDYDGQHVLLLGFHKELDDTFPDAHATWLTAMNEVLRVATKSYVRVRAPFQHMTRQQVAQFGVGYNPDFFDVAYTCYEETECGKCSHCLEKQTMRNRIGEEA